MPPLNKTFYNDEPEKFLAPENERKARVSFHTVNVREFERVVGDHPETKIGPPVSIGWGYVDVEPLSLDHFETQKARKGIRRMTSVARRNILQIFGVPDDEILRAESEVRKIRESRERTNKQGNISGRTESALQSLKSKLKRSFSRERLFRGVAEAQRHIYPISV